MCERIHRSRCDHWLVMFRTVRRYLVLSAWQLGQQSHHDYVRKCFITLVRRDSRMMTH